MHCYDGTVTFAPSNSSAFLKRFCAKYFCSDGIANSIKPLKAIIEPANIKPGVYDDVRS